MNFPVFLCSLRAAIATTRSVPGGCPVMGIPTAIVGRSETGARGESRLAEKRRLLETDCRRGQRRLHR